MNGCGAAAQVPIHRAPFSCAPAPATSLGTAKTRKSSTAARAHAGISRGYVRSTKIVQRRFEPGRIDGGSPLLFRGRVGRSGGRSSRAPAVLLQLPRGRSSRRGASTERPPTAHRLLAEPPSRSFEQRYCCCLPLESNGDPLSFVLQRGMRIDGRTASGARIVMGRLRSPKKNKFFFCGLACAVSGAQLGGDGAGGRAGLFELVGLEADGRHGGMAAPAVALGDAGEVVAAQVLLPGIGSQRHLAAVRAARDR